MKLLFLTILSIVACNQNNEDSSRNYELADKNNLICKEHQIIKENRCANTEKFCHSQGGKKLGMDGNCQNNMEYCQSKGKNYDSSLEKCTDRESSDFGEARKIEENIETDEMDETYESDEMSETNKSEVQNNNQNYTFQLSGPHYTLSSSMTERSSKLLGKINSKLHRKCFLSRVEFTGHVKPGYLRNWSRRIDAFEKKHAFCDILLSDSDLELKAKHSAGFGNAHCEAVCSTWDLPPDKTIFTSRNIEIKSDQQTEDLREGSSDHSIHLCGLKKVHVDGINLKDKPGKCDIKSSDGFKIYGESNAKCKASCISFKDESGVKETKIFRLSSFDENVAEKIIELADVENSKCILTSVELVKAFMQEENTGCHIFKEDGSWILKAINALCAAQCIVVD